MVFVPSDAVASPITARAARIACRSPSGVWEPLQVVQLIENYLLHTVEYLRHPFVVNPVRAETVKLVDHFLHFVTTRARRASGLSCIANHLQKGTDAAA